MEVIIERQIGDAKVGSIIEYKDSINGNLCYDLICFDNTTKKYCSLDLKEGKIKTSRIDTIESLIKTYGRLENVFNKNDIILTIKESR